MKHKHKYKYKFIRHSSLPAVPRFGIYDCKCGKRKYKKIR